MKRSSAEFKAKEKKVSIRRGAGIRGQLVLGLTVFVLIILIIVWVFQVLLLDYFYEQTKLGELEDVLADIEKYINDENIDTICGDLASQYDVCISVYTIEEGAISERIIDKETSPTCVIHYADQKSLNTYYDEALRSNGVFTQRFNLSPARGEDVSKDINKPGNFPDRSPNEDKKQAFNTADRLYVVAVSAKHLVDSAGNEYAAFINLRFTPVNTVQVTRNVQFGYIAAVVVLSTIVFALIFSNKLARPLERMTAEAGHMADVGYSVSFKEEGYRETRQLANTLNYAVEEISKTEQLQRELIANVSHDLRTPLTLIAGYAEIMRDIPGENSPENSQFIIDETRRLTTLVNDMLDFSKYSSGFEIPELRMFNLTGSVRTTMERYSELVRHNGYRIDFDANRDVNVCADERMILQVIYNLLNNAINYTGADKTVYIKQSVLPNGKVRISIRDTGKGISPDNITKIWDRYYKEEKSHRRAVTGSGLGLSIVSRLLQLHSASYGVESAEGYGSSFWFELQVCDE